MLAGGLDRLQHRGPSLLGQRTYGKGCVQEYYRDRAHAGVARLTTRLYALPDGSPVQRRGLEPKLLVGPTNAGEREADVPLKRWIRLPGPTCESRGFMAPAWPPHGGRVGPCDDAIACRALRKAAASSIAQARGEIPSRKRGVARLVAAPGR